MAVPPNIEKFNTVVGNIFAVLYESFPVPVYLNPFHALSYSFDDWDVTDDWQGPLKDLRESTSGNALPYLGEYSMHTIHLMLHQQSDVVIAHTEAEMKFFFHACEWLEKTQYISTASIGLNYFPDVTGVVLTDKGLEVLSAMPAAVAEGKSLGERLMEGAKSGGKTMLAEAAKQALAFGVTMGARHYGLTP